MAARSASFAGLAVIGLALVPAIARADVRIEERSTSLNSAFTRWTMIKADKRSIVTRADVSGVLYDAGAKYGAYVEIARPDKELIWDLDPQERSYREVPAQQFSRLLQKGVQIPRNANEQPLRTLYRSETTAIEVTPTGKTRRIAGLEAEQVMARVVVGAINLVSNGRFSYTFDQEVWITKDEHLLQEINGFETPYVETFGSAVSLQQAQVLGGGWNDAFITHIRALNDRVRSLKGYPLASTLTVTEVAVAQNKDEKSTERKFTVASSEVRKINFETLADSEFELPAGYINADTKVAVAGPTMPERVAATNPVKSPTPTVVAANPPAVPPTEKPGVPEKPVAVTTPEKTPTTAATPGKQPGLPDTAPAVAQAGPRPVSPNLVPSVPTNVIVKNGPSRSTGQPLAVFAQNYLPGAAGYPSIPGLALPTQNVPAPITVDEPADAFHKSKRKRHTPL